MAMSLTASSYLSAFESLLFLAKRNDRDAPSLGALLSGAKALTHFAALTARLRSCPDTSCNSGELSAAYKAL
jgi:hypothetical protein